MEVFRTINCDEITLEDVGKEVKIAGFVETIRLQSKRTSSLSEEAGKIIKIPSKELMETIINVIQTK